MMNSKQTAVFNQNTTVSTTAHGSIHAQKDITALYSRLSNEDTTDGQSGSITNQMEILENYAKSQGFTNIVHFCDDGISGTRFDRDAWLELMAEVEAGNVSRIVLKDMTRWGRNYLEVGNYMEIFKRKGIRFIAIGHNIDSDIPETLEYAPFINIMSEWFARDTSRKIKTVAHMRGNAGKPLSYTAIYGYRKSPEDKHSWVIDEIAAPIVRRIFQMTVEGMGPHQIARILTEEKAEKPSYHFAMNCSVGTKPSSRDLTDPYLWQGSTIAAILRKPEYCGHTVNFRTYKESYKDKQSKWNPPEKWKIFHNTHEPIISQEVFDTVQRLRETTRKPSKLGESNPLTGLIFCLDCGEKMYNHRQAKDYYESKHMGKVYKHKTSDHYTCKTYNRANSDFKKECSAHFIRTAVVQELVLETIKSVSSYVRNNEAEFVERIRESSEVKQVETAKAHKKQLAKNERRMAELNKLFQKVYEDNAVGRLSDERYELLSTTYEQEQADIKAQNAELQAHLTAYETDSFKADRFIEVVKRYTEFDALTPAMLNSFVEKIYVHEADKTGAQREQQVDIHLNFIGQFEPPQEEAPPPTLEEIAEADKRQKRLEYQREANKRWYAKKKQEAEWQRALEAGEISAEELEAHKQAQLAKEEAEQEEQKLRQQRRSEYAKQWARDKRAKERAEREVQKLLEPPDSELTPEELKERKRRQKNERDKNRQQDKRDAQRAGKAAYAEKTAV